MQNKQIDRNVEYFRVEPEIYRTLVAYLGKLPYEQVAGYLDALTKGTTAIFDSANRPITENIHAIREQVEIILAEEADAYVEHHRPH